MSDPMRPIDIYVNLITVPGFVDMYGSLDQFPDTSNQRRLLAGLVETVSNAVGHEKLKWSGIELRFDDGYRAAASVEEFADRIFDLREYLGYRNIFQRKLEELQY